MDSEATAPPLARAALAVPVAILAAGGWSYRYMSDDGFINLRVTQQLVHGNGPVINAGERVEAVTSPLWVALLGVADLATPVRLEWLAVVLGLILTATGLAAAIAASCRLAHSGRPGAAVLPLGAVVYAVLQPAWEYATSGLEGGLDRAWLGVVAWRFVRVAQSDRPDWTDHLGLALLVGAGPLIRPDFGIFWLAFVGAGVVGGGGRERMRWIAAAAALPVLAELGRIAYYGALLPNTAYAKEAGVARPGRGWDYLVDFVAPYRLWIPLLTLAAAALVPLVVDLTRAGARREVVFVAALVTAGLAHGGYVVAIGGDFMHARMLLPALFALLIPVAVVPIERTRLLAAAVVVPWAVLALVAFRFAIPDDFPELTGSPHMLQVIVSGSAHPVTTDDFQQSAFKVDPQLLQRVPGLYQGSLRRLRSWSSNPQPRRDGPQVVVVEYAIGLSTYSLPRDVYVVDGLGLSDAFTAHLRLERRGLPGHEKTIPAAWIWARFVRPDVPVDADLLQVPGLMFRMSGTDIAPRSDAALARDVAAARRALACPRLGRLAQVTRAPLTPGRVARNFPDALRLHGLRIPSDPQEAARAGCDPQPIRGELVKLVRRAPIGGAIGALAVHRLLWELWWSRPGRRRRRRPDLGSAGSRYAA